MRLDDLRIRLRPRGHREALDLGLALLQANWRAVYAAWLAITLPVFLLLNLLLVEHLLLAAILFWWLKPLYDRALLFVLGRALFGDTPGPGALLRALPDLLRNTGLFGQLTWARLSPYRSLVLPILQLEGLRGRARRERIRLLVRRAGGHAFWLLFLCVNVETLFTLSQYVAVVMFLPDGIDTDFLRLVLAGDPPWWLGLLGNLFYYLAMSAVEPWYVASGFMLYLNRRNELEAWDVELRLRRLARRLAAPAGAALLCLTLFVAPGTARIANAAERLPPDEAPRIIAEVLADEDFSGRETITVWVPKDWSWQWGNSEDEKQRAMFPGLPLLLADGMKLVLVALVLWGLFLIYRYRERLGLERPPVPAPAAAAPDADSQPIPDPESLPADVPARARELWQAGEARTALGLLYRAALSRLANDAGVPLHDAMTEGDVLATAARSPLPRETLDGLRALTRAWQRIAWAHRAPDAAEAERLIADWSRHFDRLSAGNAASEGTAA